jgi:hypothetical protein
MLLACRLQIIPTSNLKLIISFLILHIVLLSLFKSLSLVASTRHTHSTSHVYLRLADRPSAQFANFTMQGQPPSNGDRICPFSSQGRILVIRVSRRGILRAKSTVVFFCNYFLNARKQGNSYQRATYDDRISTVPQQSSAFFFQEIDCFYSIATTRPTYNESHKVSTRWTQTTRMLAIVST